MKHVRKKLKKVALEKAKRAPSKKINRKKQVKKKIIEKKKAKKKIKIKAKKSNKFEKKGRSKVLKKAEDVIKKKRGRPKTVAKEDFPEKKKRGRPKSTKIGEFIQCGIVESTVILKKKRGRPRKTPIAESVVKMLDQNLSADTAPLKTKRGRQKKFIEEVISETSGSIDCTTSPEEKIAFVSSGALVEGSLPVDGDIVDLNLSSEEGGDEKSKANVLHLVHEKKRRGRPRRIDSIQRLINFPEVIGSDLSANEMLESFFSEFNGIGSLKEGLKASYVFSDMELVLAKMINIVEKNGTINIPYDRYLVQMNRDSDDVSDTSLNLGKQKTQYVDMLDRDIYRSVAERFVESINERIDPKLANQKNKVYTAKWTNRVAMWRFFERYGVPISNSHSEDTSDFLLYHSRKFNEFYNDYPKSRMVSPVNPFSHYGHAFSTIMEAWMPCIKKVVKMFVENTRGGVDLQEDFVSIGYIAFLHALEKQAMAMLADAKVAQGIPFPDRLKYAVRKLINSDLPDLTGPVRVPVESKDRKKMPVSVSLDPWYDDNDY